MRRIFLLILLLCPILAQANLLITPYRLVLDERNRSGEVTLLNNSDTTKSYRISWQEKRQTEMGNYINLEETSASDFIASPMLRHSPRKVTIEPGKYQKLKVRLKIPKGLADGEYRSHLLMKVVEDLSSVPKAGEGASGLNMIIVPHVSFTIPIIVRKGKGDTSSDITAIQVAVSDAGVKSLKVDLSHKGKHSAYGSLLVYMKAGNGPVTQIGQANNIALFRELSIRHVDIPLQEQKIPKGSVIQVLYKGEGEYTGQLLGKAAIRYD